MKLRFDDAILWIVFGFLLGAASFGLVALLPLLDQYDNSLYKYQSLVGSAFALIGALLTVWIIALQIKQSQEADKQRRSDRLRAARAVLPFALSQISQYAADCIDTILPLLPDSDQDDALITPPSEPLIVLKLPDDALPILKECIESSEIEPAKVMADVATRLQIQNSRFRSLIAILSGKALARHTISVVNSYDVQRRVVDSIELYARTSQLYEYARNKSDHVAEALTLADMTNAAFNCKVDDGYSKIWQLFTDDFKN